MAPKRVIGVAGANAQVGRELLRLLRTRSDVGRIVGIARRRPDGTPDPVVEIRIADYADSDALDAAFRGLE